MGRRDEELKYNPILVFKPQGEEGNEDTNELKKDDFVLAIQTEFQRDALLKFGPKVICVDSTHGTSMTY